MAASTLVLVFVLLISCGASSSVERGGFSELELFSAPATYSVESALALSGRGGDDGDGGGTGRDVGYKLRALLAAAPVWTHHDHHEYLLQFQLLKPELHLRGKHPNANYVHHPSVWDSHSDTPFYVHWKNGLIETMYLDPKELPDFQNYKRALISLFQFQIIDGQYNETDISGECEVLYESISKDVFRKFKRHCAGDEESSVEPVAARRVTRVSLSGGGGGGRLRELYADELLRLGHAALGFKVRSWHRLLPAPATAPAPAPAHAHAHASLQDALAALPTTLASATLQLVDTEFDDDEPTLEAALAGARAALAAEGAGGRGGGAADARAALRLLPALRRAGPPALRALLHRPDNYPLLSGLCRALGLAGTANAHAAAAEFLQLGARDPLQPLAGEYLAAAALAPRPEPAVAAELARLAEEARAPAVGAAAAVAAAAAAARLPPAAADALRSRLARGLARCRDDACRERAVRALGVLRRADAAELLLEQAERGARGVALAALEALAALRHDAAALPYARRLRLQALALRPGRALEVRAAALELLVAASAARASGPAELAAAAAGLARAPAELRRVLWQRLRALAAARARVRALLPRLPARLTTWDARAMPGTSSVLVRETGWAAAGWVARLDSVQLAAGGLLRRGAVRLLAEPAAGAGAGAEGGAGAEAERELLGVAVWTRGLGALAGGAAPDPALQEGDDADDEVAGGLELSVGGVPLTQLRLFSGQAELLAHVWAGAASEPTPALRAVLPLPGLRARVPLLAGAALRLRWDAALALALDAHAQVSLWSRGARGGLRLRAGAAGAARAALRGAWGALRARQRLHAEPRMRIAADLDFYDAVALCVRVHIDDHRLDRETELWSEQGARRLRVNRTATARRPAAGRTLSLGRANDAACRALGGDGGGGDGDD